MRRLCASAGTAVAIVLSLASARGQDKPPAGPTPGTVPLTCMVLVASGAPPGAALPPPGTTLPLLARFTPAAVLDRLKADYGFVEAAMAGSASFELAAGAEQRCPGKPGGPFVVVDLVSSAGPNPSVRLRLNSGSAVLAEASVTLPPSGPALVAAGGDADRYFLLVGRRRMPPPGAPGARGGTPYGGTSAAVLERVDPALPEGTPPIQNDLLVFLEINVDGTGAVAGLRLLNGPPSLAAPVIDAVRQWKFRAGEPMVSILALNLRSRGRASASVPVEPGRGYGQPVRVRDAKPRYPAEAQRKRLQGIVIIEARIDPEGIVSDAFGIRPADGLTLAAIQAVMGWRFAPRPGQPPLRTTVTQNFSLQ